MDDYLMKYGKVSESRARLWTHQLVDAVRHCHNNRVVHMDIKPANLYLDENENIKLGDFVCGLFEGGAGWARFAW